MNHAPEHTRRFDMESTDRWKAHPERDERKFGKVQASVRRQRVHGATIEDVRTKVLRLHRMSTRFDGNGTTAVLKQALGIAEPAADVQDALPEQQRQFYQTHRDRPEELPTTQQAREEMQRLREERIAIRPLSQRSLHAAEDRLDELDDALREKYLRTMGA